MLHGQWVLKAFSPGTFPWKNFVLVKLDSVKAVQNGDANRYMALARKPKVKFEGGSPLWLAMWKSWLSMREDLQWHPPSNRAEVARLPIQGFSMVWTEPRCEQLEWSGRITQATKCGVRRLADLWDWDRYRWLSKRELRRQFDIPRCTAKALFEAVMSDLRPEVAQAMCSTPPLHTGMWVTDQDMLSQIPSWHGQQALLVTCVTPSFSQVRAYQVLSAEGLLAPSYMLCDKETKSLHPIIVVTRVNKCKWAVMETETSGQKDDPRPRAWVGRCCSAKEPLLLGRWCWSSNGHILLNYHTAQLYWFSTKFAKHPGREPIPPSWQLGIGQQKIILRQLWNSPGVTPKTAALGWRMLQRALPNADRWTGFFQIFEADTCSMCEDRPKNKSEHILYQCKEAKPIWDAIDQWVEQHKPVGGRRLNEEAALLGVSSDGPGCKPFRDKQWWPVLWLSVLFELWKGWAGAVYGGKAQPCRDAVLCAIWERWTIAGSALALRGGRRFQADHWSEIGAYR